MKHLQEWLDEYGQSHQNRINKRIHWVCVPLIMLSLLGLLFPISISFLFQSEYFNVATLLIFFASAEASSSE